MHNEGDAKKIEQENLELEGSCTNSVFNDQDGKTFKTSFPGKQKKKEGENPPLSLLKFF